MDRSLIHDVLVTPLKKITHPKGGLFKIMKNDEPGFSEFGEAYFSTINYADIKGWKKHRLMVLNLTVPVGSVRFVLFDDRKNSRSKGQFQVVELGQRNYCRLTVPSGLWMAFQGMETELNLLLNIASLRHDPQEADNLPLESITYDWACVDDYPII
jgi:dTDP-4-dehydrorhamnose 3,5-epimerase